MRDGTSSVASCLLVTQIFVPCTYCCIVTFNPTTDAGADVDHSRPVDRSGATTKPPSAHLRSYVFWPAAPNVDLD